MVHRPSCVPVVLRYLRYLRYYHRPSAIGHHRRVGRYVDGTIACVSSVCVCLQGGCAWGVQAGLQR
eukprot:4668175-Prymnesium_polylepis.1